VPARSSLPLSRQKKSPGRGFLFYKRADSLSRLHVHPLSFLVEAIVADDAIDLGKQGKVPAHTDVLPRVYSGAQLSDDNVAGPHVFTAEHFYPASLPLTISTIARTSSRFLMSHLLLPELRFNRGYF
jgi:hypothetical protein